MYVLLGANGQITSQIARRLLAAGQPIRVVGRDAGKLVALREAGAETAVGDLADAAFLEQAFTGAAAVYTMTPPCYAEPDMRAAQQRIGVTVAQALRRARVRRIVNLSSIGAELPAGTGPILALHEQEARLDAIDGLERLHLRPGSFMENLLSGAAVVAAGGPLSGMEAPDVPIPMVATRDIAALAAQELMAPRHQGVLVLHAARHPTMRDVAIAFGAAIASSGLGYEQTVPRAMKAVLHAAGFSADAANQLEELALWLSDRTALASATAGPVAVQPTTIEDFAREVFAPALMQTRRPA